jgi:hypothetical protein
MNTRILFVGLCVVVFLGEFSLLFLRYGARNITGTASIGAVGSSMGEGTTTPGSEEAPARVIKLFKREYRNEKYRFSLWYPEKMEVTYLERSGAGTVAMQDVNAGRGFQIFAVPYNDKRISEERFRMDDPSGVRTDVTKTTVAGVEAVAFYSKDARLGDTFEVWFIHEGVLYEVSTLKSLEQWLSEVILATWKFI